MSARKKTRQQINLIPEKSFENTTLGRVLAWILSTFRIIVIVTEIIVMVAFLSRFWLDAQNSDLKEKIEEKKAYLTASQNFEKEFKDTQKRLEVYAQNVQSSGNLSKSVSTIVSYLPADLFLNSLTYSEKQIDVTGYTPNEKSIQQFIANLNGSGLFEKSSVSEITSAEENLNYLNFKATILIKKT